MLVGISLAMQGQDYYWYKNQKIYLTPGDERYVLFDPCAKSGADTSEYIKTGIAKDTSLRWGIQEQTTPVATDIIYQSPSFFIEQDSSNVYVTELFYVQLKQNEDYDIFQTLWQ